MLQESSEIKRIVLALPVDPLIAAGYELKIHPRATPLLSALTGASPRCTAQDHIELPYRQLLGRCEAHAEALQSMASQLNELSSLIAQAQSLYAQAEEASRKGLNIMLRGLFMSSRESAILALTASALMGVRRSYAKEGNSTNSILWNPPHGCRKAS